MAEAAQLLSLLDRAGTRAHFVGVGGAGMAPLASIMVDRGWRVSGCDLGVSPVTEQLAAGGIAVARGHDPCHVAGQDLLVISSAVPTDAPEVVAARASGMPIAKRAQLVGALTRRRRAVCVAGTHGKTTTTSLIAAALVAAGADPDVLVGAPVPGIGVGGRSGRGELLVVESDEYDGSFLNFEPHVAVVTNVEADHLDFYADRAAIDDAFSRFLALVPRDGHAVVCADDPGARALAPAGAVTYAIDAAADWLALDVQPNAAGGSDFAARGPAGRELLVRTAVPGRHNVLNALATVAVCDLLGVDLGKAMAALADFRGASRRFEKKGEVDAVAVYDDYGHHPTEIRAVLAAARQRTRGRVWCLFQPHTYHRTASFFDDFARAFGDADRVLMLDIYSPVGREEPIAGVSSERLVAAMPHPAARYVASPAAATDAIAREAQSGDLVLTVGAGDVTRIGPLILERLAARVAS